MIDLKKLFTTLEAKKKELSNLTGATKQMLGKSELKKEDKDFFEDAINNAVQGKDVSIELVNERLNKIVDASRSNNTK